MAGTICLTFHFDAVSMLVRSWLDAGHPRDYADVTRQMREHPYRGVNVLAGRSRSGPAELPLREPGRVPGAGAAHIPGPRGPEHGDPPRCVRGGGRQHQGHSAGGRRRGVSTPPGRGGSPWRRDPAARLAPL